MDQRDTKNCNDRPPLESDYDPAAKLTSSIARGTNIVALIVFPVGFVVCLIVLASGDPAGPDHG
jgi:hypothetical protein